MKGYQQTLPLNEVKYPCFASTKLDGIRAYTFGGKFYSNSNKLIPNAELQQSAAYLPDGLDGELYCHGLDFNKIQSIVMSEWSYETHKMEFWVFDIVDIKKPFRLRLQDLNQVKTDDFVRVVSHYEIVDEAQLKAFWDYAVSSGFEGLMTRNPNMCYKYGRSGKRDQHLLKYKVWHDDEAVVIGFEEGEHNENEAFVGELGQTKRSRESAGMVPSGSLGALVVKWRGIDFKIGGGPGLDLALRQKIWDSQEKYLGQRVTFKYLNLSEYGVPRHPGFKGFRYD